MKNRLLLPGLLLSLAACASPTPPDRLEPASSGEIQKLHRFGSVLLASQPTLADLERFKEEGVRTVVNLRHPEETGDFDEAAAARALGFEYVSLPWQGPDELQDAVFDRARELFRTAPRPMLVHCGSANRVGALWIPWRVLDGGVPWETALGEAREIGLKTPEFEVKAREYIASHG